MGYVGQMTKRASFLIHQPVQTLTGGREDTFGLLLTTFGALQKTSGHRSIETGQTQWNNSWKLRVRYQEDLENGIGLRMRVVVDNRSFMIDSYTLTQEKHRYYEFILSEGERSNGAVSLPDLTEGGSGGLYQYQTILGGETSVSDSSLIGKNILSAARSTNALYIITAGTPDGAQVKFTSATGTLEYITPLAANEWISVVYG